MSNRHLRGDQSMSDPRTEDPREKSVSDWQEDGWPPCAQAQADGVPCQEIGRDCEECQKAFPNLRWPEPPR
jgi:hypothetical protein